jgi:hypothetical protein
MSSRTLAAAREPGSPVALLLPGAGYTVAAPLLAWSGAVLAARGFHVEAVTWSFDARSGEGDPVPLIEEEVVAARETARASGAIGPCMVVAKSLGTLALPWALREGLPGAWLTPISTDGAVRTALGGAGPEHLVVAGDADPFWQPEGLATAAEVVTVPGADHGLTRGDDWRGSLAAQAGVFERLDAWAADRADRGARP